MPLVTLRVTLWAQSVPDCIPTQSVGTIAAPLITRIPREPAYVGRSATPASRAVCHSHRRRPPPASP
ncbi:hypothetical protein C1X27_26155 [Pseudomonas sp. MPR-AND1B]|nr:hypothetical protein C1X26_26160 [Pseudomonas sp. MPR-R3A]PMY95270.1 hypothetical protein C1X24_26120 [Pseudomonas sp. FW305-124]PMZ69189.1 hypothetical protein C1X25_20125 [Pseudomonas sp. GW247-3R2A]PNA92510.1 hypothetical protein C1X23_15060 [Pseudomonas sp. FW300-E2]PNA95688.1 hypothetical protein C1X27_26155 [Pseudomonas sp. MPR-AND1B]PRW66683.1 hypothetical protein C7A09_22140 [Pseudomonas fluorescens]RZI22173.1 hypothetical protein EUX58_20245 [Pseudomonas sp. 770NI]